ERAVLDDVAREQVGLDAGEPGADAVERGELRGEDGLVGLLRLAVERAGREGARVGGRVAVDRAPRVDDYELARADLAVAGGCVGAGPRGAGTDDRLERELLAAFLVEEPRDVPAHVPLRAADERHLGEALEDAVGD